MKPSELEAIHPITSIMQKVRCCKCEFVVEWNQAVKEEWIADLDGESFNAYYCPACLRIARETKYITRKET